MAFHVVMMQQKQHGLKSTKNTKIMSLFLNSHVAFFLQWNTNGEILNNVFFMKKIMTDSRCQPSKWQNHYQIS